MEDSNVARLDALPDDLLLAIIAACGGGHLALPELEAVSGLGCLCKDVLQQLQRLRPTVQRYRSIASPSPGICSLLARGPLCCPTRAS